MRKSDGAAPGTEGRPLQTPPELALAASDTAVPLEHGRARAASLERAVGAIEQSRRELDLHLALRSEQT